MTDSKLTEYIGKLLEKIGDQDGEFWYRGQRYDGWRLQSGATQRIAGKRSKPEELISYHKDLLEEARWIGGKSLGRNGRKLGDLELLARLQHYGAATCLLDMTSNFNIALWFACQKAGGRRKSGKVFIVPTNPVSKHVDFFHVRSDELGKKIDYFLDPKRERKNKENESKENESLEQVYRKIIEKENLKPRFWCWKPRPLMRRMLSQSSRFIFGPDDIFKFGPDNTFEKVKLYDYIKIEAEDKEDLLLELEQQQGLKAQDIFSDIHGFASVNAREIPHRFKQYKDHLRIGRRKMQEGDFKGAIDSFNQADKLKPNDPYILLKLGDARIHLVNHNTPSTIEILREVLSQAADNLIRAQELVRDIENCELQNQIDEKLGELHSCESDLEEHFSVMEEEARLATQDFGS